MIYAHEEAVRNIKITTARWKNMLSRIQTMITLTGEGKIVTARVNWRISMRLRKELTQSLGMINDSYEYKDSIFYQDWTDTGSYAEMDREVIRILFDSRIEPGMTMDKVGGVIAN